MNTFMKYFKFDAVITTLALIAGFVFAGLPGALTVGILGVLETSLSFDNAVVNASILKNWDEKWRNRFLVWGMPVAVIGMRMIFPLLIVAIAAHMNMWNVFKMAMEKPDDYAKILVSTHMQVAAFGGAFLMMVFLKFFVDAEKDSFWLSAIERPLTKFGSLQGVEIILTLGTLVGVSYLTPSSEQLSFLLSGVFGLIVFLAAKGFGAILGGDEGATQVVKQGIAGFLYLELLDASFSFDGVIGAFAVSNQLLLISLGLGVGACFVRSLTLLLVDKGTLAEYKYLESGAFWAIGVLTAIMFASVKVEVPEVVTGLLGAGIIIVALIHSIVDKDKDEPAESLEELKNEKLSA